MMHTFTTRFNSIFSPGLSRFLACLLLTTLFTGNTLLAQCPACNGSLTVSNTNSYEGTTTAYPGNNIVICIIGTGTFRGTIQISGNNNTICIGPNVIVNGNAAVNFNGNNNRIINNGTWNIQLPNLQSNLESVENYGTMTTGGFTISNNSGFTNYKTLVVNGGVSLQGNSARFTNTLTGRATINGNFTVNGGNFNNAGSTAVTKANSTNEGNFTQQGNQANSEVTGPLLIDGNFTINEGTFDLIKAGVLVGGNYTQQGSGNTRVSGGSTAANCGSFTVNGTSTLSGGVFGFRGFLGMCDTGPGSGNFGFDVRNGGTISNDNNGNGTLQCSCNQPLPVSLMYFTFRQQNNQVTLHWATASEIDNDYFAVEKSRDGKEFREISRVKGAGTSTQKLTYQYIDDMLYGGVSYYRLKQVDFDGTIEYSKILSIHSEGTETLHIYPNPLSQQELSVEMHDALSGYMQITIYDALGKVRLDKMIVAEPEVKVSLGLLSREPGVYIVAIRKNNRIERRRLIIQ